MDRQQLEQAIAEFPLYTYAFIKPEEIVFSARVRYICEHDCPMYNTTWSCPPAVGTVEACRARVLSFRDALMIATVDEAAADGMDDARTARALHETITRRILAMVRRQADETLALSARACADCAKCSYPNEPCRHPEQMLPCVESYGILLTDLAERHGIDTFGSDRPLTWISLILYK